MTRGLATDLELFIPDSEMFPKNIFHWLDMLEQYI